MRQLILAVFVIFFAIHFSAYSQSNQNNLLRSFLDVPAPPPFDPTDLGETDVEDKYPKEFYSTEKIPPDNAPIEEIMAYWAHHNDKTSATQYSVKPTDVVAQRIFDEIEKKPEIMTGYLNILPPKKDYAEFIKRFYDEKSSMVKNPEDDIDTEIDVDEKPIASIRDAIDTAEKLNRSGFVESEISFYQMRAIKEWLSLNSKFYSDELEEKANKIKDKDSYVPSYKEELVALAKVDWEKAEPIIERLIAGKETQPASASLAIWAAYGHFMFEEDERGAAKYRRMLEDVVEDRKATAGVRDLALDAIVLEGDYDGRDDWYISLLEDETLFNLGGYTGLKTIISKGSPIKWVPKMIPLVGSQSPTVRNAAVRNLIIHLGKSNDETDKKIVIALLPWLTNRNFAREASDERADLIRATGRLNMTEAIPALIQILQTETAAEEPTFDYSGNLNISGYSGSDNKMKEAADKMKDAANRAVDKMRAGADAMKDASSDISLSDSQNAAIDALAGFKDSRAVPALLNILEQVGSFYQRKKIISAIISMGGYTPNQQVNYVEKLARKIASGGSETSVDEVYYIYDNGDFDISEQIGIVLISENEPSDGLVRLAIDRIKTLRKSEPKTAEIMNSFLQRWESKVLDIERLNLLETNNADLETILQIIIDRKELRKNYPNQLSSMRGARGMAGGITACLYEDMNEVLTATNSGDIETRVAAIGCARLIRMKLPIEAIGQLMNNSNPTLALAAERYLESEDSFEARNLILSKYPGEAKILGSRFAFIPNEKMNFEQLPLDELFTSITPFRYFQNPDIKTLKKTQEKLQEEVKSNENLMGVYGFVQDATSGHKILRIYKDKAVYAWYEDDARYRERIVNNDELKLIFDYVAAKQIESLKPSLGGCDHGDCPSEEFVMFGRNGGRRIFIQGYSSEESLQGMKLIFQALEQGESKLRYWLQNKITGLEVILDEKKIKAQSIWKNGDDFRVLILDEQKQKDINKELQIQYANARKSLNRDDFEESEGYYELYSRINQEITQQRIDRIFEPYSWRSVQGKKLGEKTSIPAEDYSISENRQFPLVDYLETPESVWNARTTEFELRKGNYEKDGMWKVARNGLTTQIAKDEYMNRFAISRDGKWAMVAKDSDEAYLTEVYRLNLQTGKEYKINLADTLMTRPITFIENTNKFLVFSAGSEYFKELPLYVRAEVKEVLEKNKKLSKTSTYYLVDANTGAFKPVTGEFAPLEQITFRNLQKTSNPDEFWAAISDEKSQETKIGRYNTKTFKFTEVMKVPEIKLTSMEIWVDEKDSKLYFIYEGHLLSLPLKANEKPTE